jgi:hypothetical protein
MATHWQKIEQIVESLLGCQAKGYELQRFFERDRVVSRDTLFRLRGTKQSTVPKVGTLRTLCDAIADPDGPFHGCTSQKIRQKQRHLHRFAAAACLDYLEGRSATIPNWEEIALNALVRLEPLGPKRPDQEALRLELKRVCARYPGPSPVLFDEKRPGDAMRCQYIIGPRGLDGRVWDYVRTIYYGHQFDVVERDAVEQRIGTMVLSLSVLPPSLQNQFAQGSSLLHSRLLQAYGYRANSLQHRFFKGRLARLTLVFSEAETKEFVRTRLSAAQRLEYFQHIQALTQAGMELFMVEEHQRMPGTDARLFSMALTWDGLATADQLTANSPERSVIVTDSYSEDYRIRKRMFDDYRATARRVDGFELAAHLE